MPRKEILVVSVPDLWATYFRGKGPTTCLISRAAHWDRISQGFAVAP